mmetsp:Transcript_25348/g.68612  ORF Transcript_25348/g.68612 Transcript_25348/m.68612 type:complete len:401 (-) Transcript_25348:354-1556(-)|eukprot:CAMPEP_0185182760 /NCGR_PEP_ID=MMETSP1140-20130426/1563_1 /TAXON_ID=298111 /ORGANISM="Pavlova sp., Strain CCMP459" /LENGTH=400 /DNA_ID=CAMNT_0027748727 /DNA_START=63 /DNA_END=1265 /DNA_ORIENTATION=+
MSAQQSTAVPALAVTKVHDKPSPLGQGTRARLSSDALNSPIGGAAGSTSRSPGQRLTLEDALTSRRSVSVNGDSDLKTKLDEPAEVMGAPARTDCGVTSETGARSENQDGWILEEPFAGHEGTVFAAVLDGHGPEGKHVAQFVTQALPRNLARQKGLRKNAPAALRAAFSETQEELAASTSGLNVELSGATATCALIVGDRLYVANLGDSRVVLGYRREGTTPVTPGGPHEEQARFASAAGAEPAVDKFSGLAARPLTRDHKPDSPEERARVEAAGGRVCPFELRGKAMGPPRVWVAKEWSPGLAVSRSFGDTCATSIGVISEPEIASYDIDVTWEVLILGSDGVWDLTANEDAVRVVVTAPGDRSPQVASAALVKSALAALQAAKRKDNVTAMVIFFRR